MSKSQEQANIDELIFGLNETMVGRFDALSERIDKLESTLTDDALALSSEQEALIAGIRQQMQVDSNSSNSMSYPKNTMLMHLYSLVWSLVTQSGLDPLVITNKTDEFVREYTPDA